jgi:5-hydroxyisourate hydrolase
MAPPTVSTHVLDAALVRPAAGVGVRLERADGTVVGEGRTDEDGRLGDLGGLGDAGDAGGLATGRHRLVLATGEWFAEQGRDTFYPEVVVTFTLGEGHHHVPLLLSPFAYSTYRGS